MTGWIINGLLSERETPKGTTDLPYGGKRFNNTDFVFLDGLLREIQAERDLVEGVNLVVEFTPTTSNNNKEYMDRSHIAVSYDDNKFYFDLAMRNIPEPKQRAAKLVQLVNSWTGIDYNWERILREAMEKGFPDIRKSIQEYNNRRKGIKKQSEEDIIFNTVTALDAIKQSKAVIPEEAKFRKVLEKCYQQHFELLKGQEIEKIKGNYPQHKDISLKIETKKGPLNILVRYATNRGWLDKGEELGITKDDARFIVKGELGKPEFGLSLEAIHAAGFKGIREAYWQIPMAIGNMARKSEANHNYQEFPCLKVSWYGRGGTIDAIDSFRKSVPHKDEAFYTAIRERFQIKHEYSGD